ncbi:hypothetical protein [Streptomyces sp. ALB3]|uniref:hypothetical protein n=1 Tax=Streptomyces sp. ALB3 TaxID=3374278 RepID=UPI0037A1A144
MLGRDYHARLADSADVAGVGRTTLHRCSSDRTELFSAATENSIAATYESEADAAIDQGSAIEAMRRLVPGPIAASHSPLIAETAPRHW